MIKFLSALILLLVTTAAQAERIRDLTSVQGVRQNSLIGYGLVVGLDGTGGPDNPDAVYHTNA